MKDPVIKIYHPLVREAIASFEETVKQLRASIEFNNGEKVNNCIDYLKLTEVLEIVDTAENMLAQKEYLVCDAVGLIGKRQYTLPKLMPKIGKEIASRLDLRSFSS